MRCLHEALDCSRASRQPSEIAADLSSLGLAHYALGGGRQGDPRALQAAVQALEECLGIAQAQQAAAAASGSQADSRYSAA
jgi:hypothetical protein